MIIACPSCDGRYDVTGYPIGQQFRCRCSTIITLEAPKTQVGALTCPNCGANVDSSSSKCAHCTHALLLKACPRCLSRVFHGHKHCPDCGAELSLVATTEATTERPCPRCDQMLAPRRVDDVVIDECMHCRGIFLDQIAIQRVITDRRQSRAESLLGALPTQLGPDRPQPGKMYIKCPVCRVVMNRKLFAAGAGVIVDVCRSHGTFFDVGELPRIIEYVQQGGLERDEKKAIDKLRQQAKDEQQKARHMAGQAAFSADNWTSGHSRGSALVDLLAALVR
jgi:Zn-finger nucleic acid-binding protein